MTSFQLMCLGLLVEQIAEYLQIVINLEVNPDILNTWISKYLKTKVAVKSTEQLSNDKYK